LIPFTTTYDRIAIRTGSAYSGTGSVRVGIYNNTNGQPSTVLLDAGTVSTTAAATIYQITINQTLEAGFYWLALNSITAAASNIFFAADSTTSSISFMNNYSDLSSSAPSIGFTQSVNVTSGFSTAGTLTASTNIPLIAIRAS
jgi:hypothetical protein